MLMRHKGFLVAELIVSIILLGMLIAGLATSMNGFSAFNECQWARQRCTAAAQAQLDSLTATGQPIAPQELQRLWPEVEVSLERAAADGAWRGLELARIVAAAQAGPRKITVRLARYLPPKPAVAQGGPS
jgi:type II secretory pathway pseudopilin PulG